MDEPAVIEEAAKKKQKKKKDKVRSAWISFVGRILAQIVGAVATVALGVLVLHKHMGSESRTPTSDGQSLVRATPPVKVPTPGGEVVIYVLQLDNSTGDADDHRFNSIARVGQRLRITAQLVDDSTDGERPVAKNADRASR